MIVINKVQPNPYLTVTRSSQMLNFAPRAWLNDAYFYSGDHCLPEGMYLLPAEVYGRVNRLGSGLRCVFTIPSIDLAEPPPSVNALVAIAPSDYEALTKLTGSEVYDVEIGIIQTSSTTYLAATISVDPKLGLARSVKPIKKKKGITCPSRGFYRLVNQSLLLACDNAVTRRMKNGEILVSELSGDVATESFVEPMRQVIEITHNGGRRLLARAVSEPEKSIAICVPIDRSSKSQAT